MKSYTGRNGWGGWVVGAAIAATLLLAPATRAQNPTDAQKPAAASKEKEEAGATDRGKSCALELTVIRIKLNEKHPFGSGLSTKELEEMVSKDKKIAAVCESLRRYGEVSVAYQLQSAAVLGGKAYAMSGGENPYFTTFAAPGQEKAAATFAPNYVNSGLTADVGLTPRGAGLTTLNYSLILEDAVPVEVKNPAVGATDTVKLWKRQRIQWRGDCTIPIDGGAFVTKSLKTDDGTAIEYFVVLQIAPTGAGERANNS